VDYAKAHDSIIFFDAAYEAFITDPEIPTPSTRLRGADCAVEFRSFSKNAGFTGTRCAPQSCRRRSRRKRLMVRMWNCGSYGTAASPPSLMGCPTSFNAERQSTARMDEAQTKALVSFYLEKIILRATECSRIGSG